MYHFAILTLFTLRALAAAWPDNEQNPTGPADGERRITRGGSFATTAVFARVSYREPRDPGYSSVDLGFRCVSDDGE